MKRNAKRTLAMLLSIMMVVSMLTLGASAADQGDGGGMPPGLLEMLDPLIPEIREGVKHVACIGDSVTWGTGVMLFDLDRESTYPVLLENELGEGYQVLNYGFSGKTLLKEGDQPYTEAKFYDISHEADADIYVIMLGTNDSKPYNWNAELYREELEEFVRSYMELPNSPQIYLMTPPRAFIVDGAEEEGFNVKNDTIRDETAPIVREVAALLGVNLIDMYKETEDHPEWFPDGVHPDAAGNAEFAKIIAGHLMANKSGSFFTDTVNSPYSRMIDALAEADIIRGIGNGKYGPDLSFSRAMAITILGRMAGVEGTYTGGFSDVTATDYYAGYVGWAVDNGIVLGDGQGHFMPDKDITGYEMDLMLARYAELVGIDYTAANQSAVTLTRAEVAAMVYYVYIQMPDTDAPITKEVVWCVNEDAAILYGEGDANIYGEMYYPANFDPNKTYPIIVGSHGLGVTSAFYSMMWGETLAKAGYIVYAIDLCGGAPEAGRNGASKSDGEWLNMSVLTEVDDVNAAVDFVKTLPYVDTDKVFLMGASQGGVVSALAAADREVKGLNDISGVILLYPYLTVSEGLREAYSSKEDLPTEPAKWLTMQNDGQELGPRYFQDMYDVDVYERIAGYNGNVLIVQGLCDEVVPYTAAIKAITESYPSQNAQLTLVAGDSSAHSFDIPFMGYTAGVDMAVSAVMESLSNWLVWNEAAT